MAFSLYFDAETGPNLFFTHAGNGAAYAFVINYTRVHDAHLST